MGLMDKIKGVLKENGHSPEVKTADGEMSYQKLQEEQEKNGDFSIRESEEKFLKDMEEHLKETVKGKENKEIENPWAKKMEKSKDKGLGR